MPEIFWMTLAVMLKGKTYVGIHEMKYILLMVMAEQERLGMIDF